MFCVVPHRPPVFPSIPPAPLVCVLDEVIHHRRVALGQDESSLVTLVFAMRSNVVSSSALVIIPIIVILPRPPLSSLQLLST